LIFQWLSRGIDSGSAAWAASAAAATTLLLGSIVMTSIVAQVNWASSRRIKAGLDKPVIPLGKEDCLPSRALKRLPSLVRLLRGDAEHGHLAFERLRRRKQMAAVAFEHRPIKRYGQKCRCAGLSFGISANHALAKRRQSECRTAFLVNQTESL